MAELYLYEPIAAGHSAELARFLAANGRKGVLIAVNSPGGDVFEGAAMYAAIKRYPGKVTARIDGQAASAASYVCMAAFEVVMAPGSSMMIHLPWANKFSGNRADMDRLRASMLQVEQAMVAGYAAKSGKDIPTITAMLERETVMDAETAVKEGFADRIEDVKGAKPVTPAELRVAAHAADAAIMASYTLTADEQADLARRNIASIRAQRAATLAEFKALKAENEALRAAIQEAEGETPAPEKPASPPPAPAPEVEPPAPATVETITAPEPKPDDVQAAARAAIVAAYRDQTPCAGNERRTDGPSAAVQSVQPSEVKMTDLNTLRAQRGERIDALNAALADPASFDRIDGEIKAMEAAIARAERVEALQASLAKQVGGTPRVEPEVAEKVGNLSLFAMQLGLHAKCKGIRSEMRETATRLYGERHPIVATLNTIDDATIVPTPVANEVIELLRAETVFLSAGPRRIDLTKGSLKIPAGATGASASYIGETEHIPASEPTFAEVSLEAKKLVAMVPMSNEILNDSIVNLESWVREDVVAAIAERTDLACLRGAGTGNTPKGLRYWAQAGAVLVANATTTYATITNDSSRMQLVMTTNLLRPRKLVWFMSPRSAMYLADLRDGNGNFIFPTMQGMDPTWRGYPVRISTQIPENLGAGTDETEIILADMAHVMFGETKGLQIDTSQEASYYDGAAQQSAFSKDLTLIRAITRHDLALRQKWCVVVLTGVRWGAE